MDPEGQGRRTVWLPGSQSLHSLASPQPGKGAGTDELGPVDVSLGNFCLQVFLCGFLPHPSTASLWWQSSPHFLFFAEISQVFKTKALPPLSPMPKAFANSSGSPKRPSCETQTWREPGSLQSGLWDSCISTIENIYMKPWSRCFTNVSSFAPYHSSVKQGFLAFPT